MLTRRLFAVSLLGLIPLRRRSTDRSLPARLPETRILFGGDVMLSRHVARVARFRHDPAWPLRDLAPVLAAADIAFANLEAPFSDRGRLVEQGMIFKAEPEMVEALRLAGIDIVSTANNHARDCGEYGVEFTLDWLERHGIAAAGSGRTTEAAHEGAVLERHDVRFGFLGYTYDQSNGNYQSVDDRVAVMDLDQLRRDVDNLRRRADVVIVSMHAGIEYQPAPNGQQREFAHAAIDAGARVVAGHHPHVVQPFERYRDGVIFYSLGNLVFDQFQRRETQQGMLAEVIFVGKHIERAAMIPVDIVQTAPRVASARPRFQVV